MPGMFAFLCENINNFKKLNPKHYITMIVDVLLLFHLMLNFLDPPLHHIKDAENGRIC